MNGIVVLSLMRMRRTVLGKKMQNTKAIAQRKYRFCDRQILYMKRIDAIILAGGLGTRLREVVKDQPKVLALLMGDPFLS